MRKNGYHKLTIKLASVSFLLGLSLIALPKIQDNIEEKTKITVTEEVQPLQRESQLINTLQTSAFSETYKVSKQQIKDKSFMEKVKDFLFKIFH